jgi:hypothetical protein
VTGLARVTGLAAGWPGAGGPLTVTHPEISRYFMTAGEAVQLVLQAAVIGHAAQVLVLDMGEQVRIVDIARRLVASTPDQVESSSRDCASARSSPRICLALARSISGRCAH